MSIAITEEHRALSLSASDFLDKHGSRDAARALLESDSEGLPPFWKELVDLGWLGIHIPESFGGSGFGMPELVVVVEELGRALAPGPFLPTVISSAVIAVCGSEDLRSRLLPSLADGTVTAGVALAADVEVRDGKAYGRAAAALCGGSADLLVLPAGDDVLIVRRQAHGLTVEVPANLDPTRRAARVELDGVAFDVLPTAGQTLTDLGRLLLAAELTGIARETTDQAAAYAKVREQFGRPIATYQAVKHHCANMLVATELATAGVWDGARAASVGGEQLSYTAAMAAVLALAAADENAQLNIQVHGGIGFTWEHDAHLYLRRATALQAVLDGEAAARDVVDLVRQGVRRERAIDLPPEAEAIRIEVRQFVEQIKDLDRDAQRTALIDSGFAMPHWPAPWGRGAGAVEQLVIEQEFAAAGIKRPQYGITGWVILTLIQHSSEDQIARWVRPALNQELIWCQLFSEPDAGSDAAGVKTKAKRVEGGWLITGQKVWTSGAHLAKKGLATVRTNTEAAKHSGITTVVVDMEAEGVEVRPLKQATGDSDFNEVFFDEVFVPDDDVVGPVDGGWTVARATLGNESVSIGGGEGSMALPVDALIGPLDANPDRLPGGSGRLGRHIAASQAIGLMNLRTASRAVAGGGPGPEGAVTKLVLSENGHEASAILTALSGSDAAYMDGPGAMVGYMALMHRAMSIAGGTSEIKRNQIGERILGLPRDPLIS